MASANPSFAECGTILANGCKWLETVREVAQVNATNLLALEDTLVQSLEGTTGNITSIANALISLRAGVSSALDGTSFIEALLFNFRYAIDSESSDITAFVEDLNRYMDTNSQSVNSRDITFGAFTPGGSNVGNGTIRRLTVDRYANDIESILTATGWTARIVRDQNSDGGAAGQEVWEIRGGPAGEDNLDAQDTDRGTGAVQEITNKSADDSTLSNPSFSSFSGTAAVPTAITGWTVVNSIGNFEIDQTNFYVEARIEGGTPGSLVIKATDEANQALTVRGTTLDPAVARYLQVAWNRQVNSATGTLTIHMGSQSVSVVAAAQTGWQILLIPLDENSWPVNFTEDALDIRVVWTQTGGMGILVDDVRFLPVDDLVDTIPTIALSADTRELLDDTGTVSDTIATNGVIQNTISRNLGLYLQSATGGAETIPDA